MVKKMIESEDQPLNVERKTSNKDKQSSEKYQEEEVNESDVVEVDSERLLSCFITSFKKTGKCDQIKELLQKHQKLIFDILEKDDFDAIFVIIAKGYLQIFLTIIELFSKKHAKQILLFQHYKILKYLMLLNNKSNLIDDPFFKQSLNLFNKEDHLQVYRIIMKYSNDEMLQLFLKLQNHPVNSTNKFFCFLKNLFIFMNDNPIFHTYLRNTS